MLPGINFYYWLPEEPCPISFEINRAMTPPPSPFSKSLTPDKKRLISSPLQQCFHVWSLLVATGAAEMSLCASPPTSQKRRVGNSFRARSSLCFSPTKDTHLRELGTKLIRKLCQAQVGMFLIRWASVLCVFSRWTQMHVWCYLTVTECFVQRAVLSTSCVLTGGVFLTLSLSSPGLLGWVQPKDWPHIGQLAENENWF